MSSSGRLFFSDFSRIQFGTISGPTLPRRQRVRMNNLLARDTGEEIVIDGSGVEGLLLANAGAFEGSADGQVVEFVGYSEARDGGESRWRFSLGLPPALAADSVSRIDCVNGQLQRLTGIPISGQSSGIPSETGVDAAPKLNALFSKLGANGPGAEVVLQPSRIDVGPTRREVYSTITVAGTQYGSSSIRGGTSGHGQGYNGTTLVWMGAPNVPMISVECANTIFQNITFAVGAGKTCQQLVNIQSNGVYTVTKNSFVDCQFVGSGGTLQDCVTIDYYVNSVNIEDHEWLNCAFYDFNRYGIGVFGAQAYKLKVSDCFILQSDVSLIRKGSGIFSLEDSFNAVIERTFFYKLESMVSGQGINWVIRDCTSEGCKRLYDGQGFTGYGSALIIEGGRHALDGLTSSSIGPRTYAASDRSFVIQQGANSINVRGVHFDNGATDLAMLISSGNSTAAIVSHGNTYPTRTPFFPSEAGVFSAGDIYQGASGSEAIPPRHGRLNKDGVTTIADAATSATVTLSQTEPNANYVPLLTVLPGTGAASAGSRIAWPTAITTTQFTINLGAAPGVGTDVVVAWRLVPRGA